jgi:hypothetical protein
MDFLSSNRVKMHPTSLPPKIPQKYHRDPKNERNPDLVLVLNFEL